ncbi:exodeoxyribonuclease VII large subunit [Acholeplasma granularum]|uniref:exodeoxyribonuclease VII large subunit n=1 Tax=Acholeplasma granularum TaxID=264635 RepID=UPI0004AF603C|nr:exodeoxyribonuclease VII large subunit [Acholeplasma granularum]
MQEVKYLTVSALTEYLKVKLENDPHLKKIFLKGEISNFTHHTSGHLYFSLKDENATISAMMFKTYAQTINFKPKSGDKVLVEGYMSLYKARGTYSISLFSMTLDGIGDLFLKFEQNKKMFAELGYFDESLKKPIPKYPTKIAVLTSKTGAVIQDIKTTVERRYLLTKIILYPILVQGEDSKNDIVKTIQKVNNDNEVDVIILGRGGGSIEDLWSFNEPEVVVAIHQSKIPIITAIGHETDTTLADYVSDLRAPTPTAAAELATPNTSDLIKEIKDKTSLMEYYMNERIKNIHQTLMNLEERLHVSSPKSKLEQEKRSVDNLKLRIENQYHKNISDKTYQLNILTNKLQHPQTKIDNYKDKINLYYNQLLKNYKVNVTYKILKTQSLNDKLDSLNPLRVMERGYALTTKDNKVITSINQISIDDHLSIQFKDGMTNVKVISKEGKKDE